MSRYVLEDEVNFLEELFFVLSNSKCIAYR